MKRKRISTYISEWIVMSSLWLLLAPVCVMAQETVNVPLTDEEWKETPLYQGIYIGADIYGLASKAFGSDITSAEVSAEVNLKNLGSLFPGRDELQRILQETLSAGGIPGRIKVWIYHLFIRRGCPQHD